MLGSIIQAKQIVNIIINIMIKINIFILIFKSERSTPTPLIIFRICLRKYINKKTRIKAKKLARQKWNLGENSPKSEIRLADFFAFILVFNTLIV